MCRVSSKLIRILKINTAFLIEIFIESFSGISGVYQHFFFPYKRYSLKLTTPPFLGHTPAFILCGLQSVGCLLEQIVVFICNNFSVLLKNHLVVGLPILIKTTSKIYCVSPVSVLFIITTRLSALLYSVCEFQ